MYCRAGLVSIAIPKVRASQKRNMTAFYLIAKRRRAITGGLQGGAALVGWGGGHENAQQGRRYRVQQQQVPSHSAHGAPARKTPTIAVFQTGPRYPHRRSSRAEMINWSRFRILQQHADLWLARRRTHKSLFHRFVWPVPALLVSSSKHATAHRPSDRQIHTNVAQGSRPPLVVCGLRSQSFGYHRNFGPLHDLPIVGFRAASPRSRIIIAMDCIHLSCKLLSL
jgi:hypothetical protein